MVWDKIAVVFGQVVIEKPGVRRRLLNRRADAAARYRGHWPVAVRALPVRAPQAWSGRRAGCQPAGSTIASGPGYTSDSCPSA
ncbi:hypothetical protein GCM10009764_24340 [Nocardia ninae]|uniref:Uncharacterized protein n=1 Tax=Nocardia ninae NBRC 108245 TaxID=1210091 RepID=A0A511MF68_9NOCA|nr:hypothetical protein NN4_35800 [Nocardia ninae NBRC 108245]